MKLNHAAATLALLGWYLMVPPIEKTGPLNLNPDAPFALWRTAQVFDTEQQCESEKAAIIEKAKELLREPGE